jgi:hypothetical protein
LNLRIDTAEYGDFIGADEDFEWCPAIWEIVEALAMEGEKW